MTKSYSTRVPAPAITQPDINDACSVRTNDVMHENPTGSCMANSKINKSGNKLLNCKKEINIATHNIRTLKHQGKTEELAYAFNNANLNILGIVDHKLIHSEETQTKQLDGCTLITSSAWRNASGAANGGVGIVVSRTTKSALADVKPFNERIIIAHFNGNPATTVIVHYSPTEGSDSAENHYNNLSNAIKSIPKHNVLIVVGDCNAHIGTEDALFTFHDDTNTNGKLLLDLVEENNLVITNTSFQKRQGKLWTYLSDMNGSKSQIDYILINKKWKNSVKNVEAYSTFASIGSDHRVVSAKLKLSLRTCKTPPRKTAFDWNVLRGNSDLQQLYTVKVLNRYEQLCDESESDITENYQNFAQANNEAAKALIPPKARSKRKVLSKNDNVVAARSSVNEAFCNYESDPTKENEQLLQEEKAKLKNAYDHAFEEELERMITKVENADARAQHAESWKLINQISGRKAPKQGILKGNSTKERVDSWYKHFSDLLGKEPVTPDMNNPEEIQTIFNEADLNIKTGPFTMEEYQNVKKVLQTGKASGEDGIYPEVLKYCNLDETILSYANKLLIDHQKPQQWSDINLIPIPKSGDLGYTTNYRGIALSSIVAKVVNRMLLNRVQPKLDPHLRPNQNGFRPGRSTTAHILALRRIIEGVKRNNLKAVILFVDFSKAFDSIHRGKMMKILRAYGIPEQLVNAISLLYEKTRAKVLSPDGETDYFEILAGVLQGDTLAPYLFAIVIDYVMRRAVGDKAQELGFTLIPRKSRRVPSINVTDLCFADDIALLVNELQQAQELLQLVENEAAKVGLHVNGPKTELMSFNQDMLLSIKTICGHIIKEVENFKYLGGRMKSTEDDIKVRKALAWSACHKLSKVWTSSLKRPIKVRLFIATVESVLLYNCNTWTLTKQMEKSLNGMYTRMLRMALNVSWKQHITNEDLYGDLPKVTSKIAMHRLKLAGHCVRHPEEIASQLVLWQPVRGRPGRGRKPTDFIDVIKQDTQLEDIEDIRRVMLDRSLWHEFVKQARSGGRPR